MFGISYKTSFKIEIIIIFVAFGFKQRCYKEHFKEFVFKHYSAVVIQTLLTSDMIIVWSLPDWSYPFKAKCSQPSWQCIPIKANASRPRNCAVRVSSREIRLAQMTMMPLKPNLQTSRLNTNQLLENWCKQASPQTSYHFKTWRNWTLSFPVASSMKGQNFHATRKVL